MKTLTSALLAAVLAVSGCSHARAKELPTKAELEPQSAFSEGLLDPDVNFTGRWKNQRGSIMDLREDPSSGRLTGQYTTYVGGPGGTPFTRPLYGQSHGDQVTFYVDWAPYSMTSWVGQLLTAYSGGETLDTVWVNTVNIPNATEPNDGWSGVRNGADHFTKIP